MEGKLLKYVGIVFILNLVFMVVDILAHRGTGIFSWIILIVAILLVLFTFMFSIRYVLQNSTFEGYLNSLVVPAILPISWFVGWLVSWFVLPLRLLSESAVLICVPVSIILVGLIAIINLVIYFIKKPQPRA